MHTVVLIQLIPSVYLGLCRSIEIFQATLDMAAHHVRRHLHRPFYSHRLDALTLQSP